MTKRMQRVDEMHEPPTVGEFYSVPTIFYRFGGGWLGVPKPRHYPIMGTRHEDAEHFEFPHFHYHMDWRFAPRSAIKYAEGRNFYGEQNIFGIPLARTGEEDHGPVTYRRMKCLRIPPINTLFTVGHADGRLSGGQKLHRAWLGKPAARGPNGLICPHRGTPLGSAVIEPDGTVTCPLHGLKFCAATGESIATHKWTPTDPTKGIQE